jgi:hypothetical protein
MAIIPPRQLDPVAGAEAAHSDTETPPPTPRPPRSALTRARQRYAMCPWLNLARAANVPAPGQDRGSETISNRAAALGPRLRSLSIEEIARRLRRDNREVRDKVAEVGRACR